MTPMSLTLGTALGATLAALVACASPTPPPTEQMAVSMAAMARAEGAGGAELAPTEMTMARDKMARAHKAMAAKDYDTALALSQQAQLDAQLADAKAEAAKAAKSATALAEASRVLREEMARKKP